ncbi:hypothetical protein Esti_003759 [Eimeria stiedai]
MKVPHAPPHAHSNIVIAAATNTQKFDTREMHAEEESRQLLQLRWEERQKESCLRVLSSIFSTSFAASSRACETPSLRSMLSEYEVPPQVDTSQAFSLLEVRLSRLREQRRLRTTGVLRVAVIAAAIAATAFLVLSCFRQATSRVYGVSYRRRLSGHGDPQGTDGSSTSSSCGSTDSAAESSEDGNQQGADGVPAQGNPQGPPQEPAQAGDVQATGTSREGQEQEEAAPGASGGAEGGQEEEPPPPSPPRKRKRKTRHLESGVRSEAQPSTSAAVAAAAAASSAPQPVEPVEEPNPALRFAQLNVMARLTSQAVAGARKEHSEKGVDRSGRMVLVLLFQKSLEQELAFVTSQVFPTVKSTQTYLASLQYAQRILGAAQKTIEAQGVSSSSGGVEQVESQLWVDAILRVAYQTARLRFAVKSCFESPTDRRRSHLKKLFDGSSGTRAHAQAVLGRSPGGALASARELLQKELLELMDARALAASLLFSEAQQERAAGDPPPPPPPPPTPHPAPPKPESLSPVEQMVQKMLALAEELLSMVSGRTPTPLGFFEVALTRLIQQSLECIETARSVQTAGVLTPGEASAVSAAVMALEQAMAEALARQG